MTKTTMASPDGIKIESFYGGRKYTLSLAMAEKLKGAYIIANGAEEVDAKAPEDTLEEKKDKEKKDKKNAGVAPQNKAANAKENK